MVSTIVGERLLTDSKDESDSTKQQHLNKLKTKTLMIYTVVSILATALISIYSYYAVKLVKDFNRSQEDWDKDYFRNFRLRWIISAILNVGQILMSLLMMCLLKN